MERHTKVESMFPIDKPSEVIYVSVMRTGGRPEQLRVGEVGIHVDTAAGFVRFPRTTRG